MEVIQEQLVEQVMLQTISITLPAEYGHQQLRMPAAILRSVVGNFGSNHLSSFLDNDPCFALFTAFARSFTFSEHAS